MMSVRSQIISQFESETAGVVRRPGEPKAEKRAYQYGVQLNFIRPGRPVEDCYVESFKVG